MRRSLSPRVRNTILSALAFLAGTLILAFFALMSGAVTADYARTAIFMFVVIGIYIIMTFVISFHENDSADRLWLGVILGLMIAVSFGGGVGTFYPVFASPALAKTILMVAVGIDALLATIYWFYTSYINDDYTI